MPTISCLVLGKMTQLTLHFLREYNQVIPDLPSTYKDSRGLLLIASTWGGRCLCALSKTTS